MGQVKENVRKLTRIGSQSAPAKFASLLSRVNEIEINDEALEQKIAKNLEKIEWGEEDEEYRSLDILSWDFDVFSIKSRNPLSFLAWKCLHDTGIIQEVSL